MENVSTSRKQLAAVTCPKEDVAAAAVAEEVAVAPGEAAAVVATVSA